MITISRAEYDALRLENDTLSQRLEYLMEQIRLAKKKAFGASSEKSGEEVLNQMSLFFDEAELLAKEEAPETTTIAAHTRKKRSSKLENILPDNVPVEAIEHAIPEDERNCPSCGGIMMPIGTEVRRALVFIPAQAKIREDVYYAYGCSVCKRDNIETPILNTPKAPVVIPGSFASPEAIVHIMTQKFVMGSPLYR